MDSVFSYLFTTIEWTGSGMLLGLDAMFRLDFVSDAQNFIQFFLF
jgi:hypothetical protein